MTRIQAKKEVKEFANRYWVRLIFSGNLTSDGQADIKDEFVTINSKLTIQSMFSAAAHEISHILNKREGKYPIYHSYKGWIEPYSSKFLATAHRAELYTDKRGKKLLKLEYPQFKYESGYSNTKSSKKWMREHLKEKK